MPPSPELPALSPLGERRSLSEEIFHTLRDAISDGRFAPGAPLREVALASQFGVSPTPVREALRRLERENLVTTFPHRGTVVAPTSPRLMANLYEMHEVLEAFAVRRAAARAPHDLTAHFSILRSLDDSLNRKSQHQFNRLDLKFHRLLNDLGGNDQISERIEQTHRRIQATRLRLDIDLPDRPRQSQAQHRELIRAIERGDADGAERIARLHIGSVRTAVLAAMEGEGLAETSPSR